MALFGTFAKDKHFSELGSSLDVNGDTVVAATRRTTTQQNLSGATDVARADYDIRRAVVPISNTELEALAAAPKELIPTPGAGKRVLVTWYRLYLHFNGDAQDDAALDGNLRLFYKGTSTAVAAAVEADGFVDATADRVFTGTEGYLSAAGGALANVDNRAIELRNDGAEFTGGDSTLTAEVFYRIIDVSI